MTAESATNDNSSKPNRQDDPQKVPQITPPERIAGLDELLWRDRSRQNLDEAEHRYQQSLFDLYAKCVDAADATSERRLKTNAFFLTLHTAVIAGLFYALSEGSNIKFAVFSILSGSAGIALTVVWARILRFHRGINSAKYAVIAELETKMIASPIVRAEFGLLGDEQSVEKWGIHYESLSKEESKVPLITGALYLLIVILGIWLAFNPDVI